MITARVKIVIYNALIGQKDMPAWELADRVIRRLADEGIGFTTRKRDLESSHV